MNRCLVVAGALLAALVPTPATAAAKGADALLNTLAEGTLQTALGVQLVAVFPDLGVFAAVGLGVKSVPQDAKLNQIIAQLKVLQADVESLRADVSTVGSTIVNASVSAQLSPKLTSMDIEQKAIHNCAVQVQEVAANAGTDAADELLHSLALQIVGRGAGGNCDLTGHFSTIHSTIMSDVDVGAATDGGVFSLLGRAMRDPANTTSLPFERMASFFIRYALVQREAMELIRGAYTLLGEPENIEAHLSEMHDQLVDEEIAFLRGTDAYILAGSPPFDPSPAGLADAIVQRIEGVRRSATTFSVSALNPSFEPYFTDYSSYANVFLPDLIQGEVSSYYNANEMDLTSGLADCHLSPPKDGFAFVRPSNDGSYKVESSCTLYLERHLLKNPPADADLRFAYRGRESGRNFTWTRRNAVTLNLETQAENLALGGSTLGGSSGLSAFSIVADTADPTVVSLKIDLPDANSAWIRRGGSRPFTAAGFAEIVRFTKQAFGPEYPDRYALKLGDQYLGIDETGFATLVDAPLYFDFRLTPDGHTELVYDGGVLYVNDQFMHAYFGESPHDELMNHSNLATLGSGYVAEGHRIWGPCLNQFGSTLAYWTDYYGNSHPTTQCDLVGLASNAFKVKLSNPMAEDRAFRFTLQSRIDLQQGLGSGGAGLHCFQNPPVTSDNNQLNVPSSGISYVDTTTPTLTSPETTFDPSSWVLVIPALGETEIDCQFTDWTGVDPAVLTLTKFVLEPCKFPSSGSCEVFQ